MRNLLKDIEELCSENLDEHSCVIFAIKSHNHLVQMINNLNEIGYCFNYHGWLMKMNDLKREFDNQESDFIELDLIEKTVTYSSVTKLKDRLDKEDFKFLITQDYIKKMKRKKLNL
jgi:hypothetical protein